MDSDVSFVILLYRGNNVKISSLKVYRGHFMLEILFSESAGGLMAFAMVKHSQEGGPFAFFHRMVRPTLTKSEKSRKKKGRIGLPPFRLTEAGMI